VSFPVTEVEAAGRRARGPPFVFGWTQRGEPNGKLRALRRQQHL
jgi:hypothetical protein